MILDEIAESARKRVASAKEHISLPLLREQALSVSRIPPDFKNALSGPGISFICEVKRASPSKGIIAEDFPYLQIAREYEAAGAAAVSVLTEPEYFLGKDAYLREIADTVKIPLLRKDFIVDSYQIYEAKLLGASAVLLICAILDQDALSSYIECAHYLGLAALVETHTEGEISRALRAGAQIIGVNNRDLKTFQVDLTAALHLRSLVPPDRLFVSESGIRSRADIRALEACGVDGVLIGEALIRAADRGMYLAQLRGNGDAED
ncbi:MAG: indole-3-glycerol phosphate synthase TrpC [Treponema sp.]|jgi:indole-3-glycerol phosphate synthase|nr:indole-3-glycerol phosphate synthase TrpC [Treponema sp.]